MVNVTDTEMKLRGRADELLAAAKRASIATTADVEKGIDLAQLIRTARKKLDDERKEIVEPFNKGVKAINERFKLFTNRLDEARQLIDGKILQFKAKEDEERRKAAELARASVAPEADNFEFDDIGCFVPTGPTRGNLASASTITKYDATVIDIRSVPADLLLVDMVEVRRRINGAERLKDIPGLEIFEVKTLSVR